MKKTTVLAVLTALPFLTGMSGIGCPGGPGGPGGPADLLPPGELPDCPDYAGPVVPCDECTPLAPSNLSLSMEEQIHGLFGRWVELRWIDNSHNETGFVIERKEPDVDWEIIATVDANHPYYEDRDVVWDRARYSYRVQAHNQTAGVSSFSNIAGADATEPPPPPLPAPSDLTAAPGPDNTSINLTWAYHGGAVTCFEVERSVDAVSGSTVSLAEGFQRIGLVSEACYVDEDVDPSQHAEFPYAYRVKAYHVASSGPLDVRRSAYSNRAYAVPDPDGRVAPQLEVQRSGPGSGFVTINGHPCSTGRCIAWAYPVGSSVTIPAEPNDGSTFEGWSGCDSVQGMDCTVIMNEPKTVTVTFGQASDPPVSPPASTGTLRIENHAPFDLISITLDGDELLLPGDVIPADHYQEFINISTGSHVMVVEIGETVASGQYDGLPGGTNVYYTWSNVQVSIPENDSATLPIYWTVANLMEGNWCGVDLYGNLHYISFHGDGSFEGYLWPSGSCTNLPGAGWVPIQWGSIQGPNWPDHDAAAFYLDQPDGLNLCFVGRAYYWSELVGYWFLPADAAVVSLYRQ